MQCVVTKETNSHLRKLDIMNIGDWIRDKYIKSKVDNIMLGGDITYFDNIAGDMDMEQVTLYDKLTIAIALSTSPNEILILKQQLNELLRKVIEIKVRKELKTKNANKLVSNNVI